MEQRIKDLEGLDVHIQKIENVFGSLLQSLQWDKQTLLEKKNQNLVTCNYDSNHRVPPDKLDGHEDKCRLKSLGYRETDSFLPEPLDPDSKTVVKLSKQDMINIINKAAECEKEFKKGQGPDDLEPMTVERLQSMYTSDERRAIYDAVVKAAPVRHDLDDLTLPSASGDEKRNNEKSFMEILAETRNMKRRRTKYRVAPKTKNYSDALRDVIKTQMEMYSEICGVKVHETQDTTQTTTDNSVNDHHSHKSNNRQRNNNNRQSQFYDRTNKNKYYERTKRNDKKCKTSHRDHKFHRNNYEHRRASRDRNDEHNMIDINDIKLEPIDIKLEPEDKNSDVSDRGESSSGRIHSGDKRDDYRNDRDYTRDREKEHRRDDIRHKRNDSRDRYSRDDSRKNKYSRDDSRNTKYYRDDSRDSTYYRDDSRDSRYYRDDSRDSRYSRDDSRDARYSRDDSKDKRYSRDESRDTRYSRNEKDDYHRHSRKPKDGYKSDENDYKRKNRKNKHKRHYETYNTDDVECKKIKIEKE